MKDLTVAEILDFDIAKELKVEDKKQKDELYMNFSQILFEQILLNTLHLLEESDENKLSEFLKTDTDIPELVEFLSKRVSNLNEIVGQQIIEIKEDAIKLINNKK